jgi:hypothetical protein
MVARMRRAFANTASILSLLLIVGGSTAQPTHVWQADLQIRTLEVTKNKTTMSVRVVIYTENNDEARAARVLFLLPIGVGVDRLAAGCVATPGPSNVPSLRASVACELGAIPDRAFREVWISTTLPAEGVPRRVGVFAYSATPDPIPGNNYAERIVP